jgi:hypothetical protein
MSSRALMRGEVPRAERIRELLAKGLPTEVIAVRVGCKPSDIARVANKRARA